LTEKSLLQNSPFQIQFWTVQCLNSQRKREAKRNQDEARTAMKRHLETMGVHLRPKPTPVPLAAS